MEYETTTTAAEPKKTISKKKILFWCGSFIVFVAVIALTVFTINRFQNIKTVQTALTNVIPLMEKANGDNGYPQALPTGATGDKKVKIEGGGSFDGTTYCIVGTSTSDAAVVYHVTSSSKQPQADGCPKVSSTTKPGSVTGIATTTIGSSELGYVWNSASDGLSYTLQCATDKDFTQDVISTTNATTTRVCENLKDNTAYFIHIRANNAVGAGPWSSALTVTTHGLSISPDTPTLTAVSSTSIHYSWNRVAGAQSYIVEWASDVNMAKDFKSVTLTGTSGTASGLTPNTRYFFHVKAVTAAFDATHAAFSPQSYISTPAK